MKICQLMYVSRATKPMTREELQAIAMESSIKNKKLNITGALMMCDGYFLQLLEGEDETALHELFHKICRDPRHRDAELLEITPAKSRLFADWGMSLLHEESAVQSDHARIEQLIQRIMRRDRTPRIGIDALKLLRDLRDKIAQQAQPAA
jgi:hypothetical protein